MSTAKLHVSPDLVLTAAKLLEPDRNSMQYMSFVNYTVRENSRNAIPLFMLRTLKLF